MAKEQLRAGVIAILSGYLSGIPGADPDQAELNAGKIVDGLTAIMLITAAEKAEWAIQEHIDAPATRYGHGMRY